MRPEGAQDLREDVEDTAHRPNSRPSIVHSQYSHNPIDAALSGL